MLIPGDKNGQEKAVFDNPKKWYWFLPRRLKLKRGFVTEKKLAVGRAQKLLHNTYVCLHLERERRGGVGRKWLIKCILFASKIWILIWRFLFGFVMMIIGVC